MELRTGRGAIVLDEVDEGDELEEGAEVAVWIGESGGKPIATRRRTLSMTT